MGYRTDIERALDELVCHEEGMKFQSLAVTLAKQRWPALVACERKKDLGLDALSAYGERIGLACSLTAKIGKIRDDAKNIQKHFPDIKKLIFVTPLPVTNLKAKPWKNQILSEFGYELVVVPREDIITSLMNPSNASICRAQLGIPLPFEVAIQNLIEKARAAASEIGTAWLAQPRLQGRPLLNLQVAKLDKDGRETGEVLDLEDIRTALAHNHRIVLEAPAGRGKTTTLVQLASQNSDAGGLSFLINLPSWVKERVDILEFIARRPQFLGISAADLMKLYKTEHFSFLLNGWNEISDSHSDEAVQALAELERNFPAAGIIVATRTHQITPPLPGSFRVKLQPLSRGQRAEYLNLYLRERAAELGQKLDCDAVLDDLTRTFLILAEVARIFERGEPIPKTKMGVLQAVMRLLEQSEEHQAHLQRQPLMGRAQNYLTELAITMTTEGSVEIQDSRAREICCAVAVNLQSTRQIVMLPESGPLLDALCKHHILEPLESPSAAFRFEHQQFQEFYAAVMLRAELRKLAAATDLAMERQFTRKYLNEPVWEEPLRMVAESIGAEDGAASEGSNTIAEGKRLVDMALGVDPIFAAQLSRLCGNLVWNAVRVAVCDCLRSYLRPSDGLYRQYGLAGMLATGSDQFTDIILPLLTSDDQQVRLNTYRAWHEFYLSSLGPNWQSVVKGWREELQIEFISEVTHHRWMPEIAESFLNDVNPKIREATIQALSWSGDWSELTRLLTSMDDVAFGNAVRNLYPQAVPAAVRPRAIKAALECFQQSESAAIRFGILLRVTELGGVVLAEKFKSELAALSGEETNRVYEVSLKTVLDIVQKEDPHWVSLWVANHILDGSLRNESWIGFVTAIPDSMRGELLSRISSNDLQHKDTSAIIAVLTATVDRDLAEQIFERLCSAQNDIPEIWSDQSRLPQAIFGQLEALFRALPPDLAVAGLSHVFKSEIDPTKFKMIIDLFKSGGRDETDLRSELPEDLRRDFRTYLKRTIPFVLSHEDFSGQMKGYLASVLARIGETEDMADLRQLIQSDINRVRSRREGLAKGEPSAMAKGGGIMTWASWHIQAVTSLDPKAAEAILLDLLQEREYEIDAAKGLAQLARNQTASIEEPLIFNTKNFKFVWEARNGRRLISFDEERRQRYAVAVTQRVSVLLCERRNTAQPAAYDYRLNELAKVVTVIDPHDSGSVVSEIIALPVAPRGTLNAWQRVDILENLLFAGAPLDAKETLKILDEIIERIRDHYLYDDQTTNLLARCLCLLPFVNDTAIGISRIREVISTRPHWYHHLRELAMALGHSHCNEGLELLLELAGPDGTNLQHMGREWLKAVAVVNTADSRRVLLSFIDPEIESLPVNPNFEDSYGDHIAFYIAEMARSHPAAMERILCLSNLELAGTKRSLLSRVVEQVGTPDAILATLNLIRDDAAEPVPHRLWRAIEAIFLEQRPYGNTRSYTLLSRSANEIRERLFQMLCHDKVRRKSAAAILAQIEMWRLEHGRPNSEPRHALIDSGESWPPLEVVS
jgi:hypothetical protein